MTYFLGTTASRDSSRACTDDQRAQDLTGTRDGTREDAGALKVPLGTKDLAALDCDALRQAALESARQAHECPACRAGAYVGRPNDVGRVCARCGYGGEE